MKEITMTADITGLFLKEEYDIDNISKIFFPDWLLISMKKEFIYNKGYFRTIAVLRARCSSPETSEKYNFLKGANRIINITVEGNMGEYYFDDFSTSSARKNMVAPISKNKLPLKVKDKKNLVRSIEI